MKKLLLTCFMLFISAQVYASGIVTMPLPKGTTIIGETVGDYAGEIVLSVGDINGDYFPDLLVTARDYNKSIHQGRVYIFYGSISGFPAVINLANANIKITGGNYDWAGSQAYAAGDINNDGLKDIIVSGGANLYIIYGSKTLPSSIYLSAVGTTVKGVKIAGTDGLYSLATGDIDRDGYNDIAFHGLGLPYGDVNVLYGSKIPQSTGIISLTSTYFDGIKGFRILSSVSNGMSTISLLDINNDGFKDIAMVDKQKVIVTILFGKPTSFPSIVTLTTLLLNGIDGISINTGVAINAYGIASIKDINKDTFEDILLWGVQPGGSSDIAVIYGKSSFTSLINLQNDLDGIKGFRITGVSQVTADAIMPVGPAGDYNSDGANDFMIGTGNKVVIINGRIAFPPTYTVTNDAQLDNTKIVSSSPIGTSVQYAENLYGGIGCSTDTAYLVGSIPNPTAIGKSYIISIKK